MAEATRSETPAGVEKAVTSPLVRAVAWISWGLTLMLIAGGVAVVVLGPDQPLVDQVILLSIIFTFSGVGTLLVLRLPQNATGWLFLLAGLLAGINGFSALYAEFAWASDLPGSVAAGWAEQLTFFPAVVMLAAPMLYFPQGRLPSPRWLWVAAAMLVAIILLGLGNALRPGELDVIPATNPLGTEPLARYELVISSAGFISLLAGLLGTAASMVVRFRRARGRERQQLKLLAYAAIWAGLGMALVFILATAENETALDLPPWVSSLGPLALLGVLGIPLAASIAILRYRLYDIDLVINRTLVYGSLSVLLVTVYGTGVVLLPQLAPIGGENDLAVAVSALTVAALFNPLRRRIQDFVDRRFYRSRYDAQQTVESFAARLREDVDLDEVQEHLIEVVGETLAPTSVEVWLRQRGPSAPSAES